jgi:hypothetical protein
MSANIFCQLVQINNILEVWGFIRLQQGKGCWGGLDLNSTSDKVTECFFLRFYSVPPGEFQVIIIISIIVISCISSFSFSSVAHNGRCFLK